MIVSGNLVDAFAREIYPAEVEIENGIIKKIRRVAIAESQYIMPGFIDSHVHIESSMMTPFRFGEIAAHHGTVAVITDPHEIANVLGVDGINFMIENAKKSSIKMFFGLPSCVPSTVFETSGATINASQTSELLSRPDIWFLAEMMNYPGVLSGDKEVVSKIAAAKLVNKPCDGHAPLLSGSDLEKYVESGISTDHECSNIAEAEEKLSKGMKILIREGSAAKNYQKLKNLIDKYPDEVMFCTDDCHPDELQKRHINYLLALSVENNFDIYNIVKAASINPVLHYKIPVGLLRENDPADFIIVDNLKTFPVKATFVNGVNILENTMKPQIANEDVCPNKFSRNAIDKRDLEIDFEGGQVKIIKVIDGELLTEKEVDTPKILNGKIIADTERDILKIVVVSRYDNSKPAVGLIRGFGLKHGALSCSIAHDSHNIVAVGVNEDDLCEAINQVIENKGGMSAVDGKESRVIKLPIAGLMSNEPCEKISAEYEEINNFVKEMSCKLKTPYMTMAFMPLLVIPKIKISDKGLFDVEKFEFTSVGIKEF